MQKTWSQSKDPPDIVLLSPLHPIMVLGCSLTCWHQESLHTQLTHSWDYRSALPDCEQ